MKKIYLILIILLGSNVLLAHTSDEILNQVLENNQELIALRELNKLTILNAKKDLLPENPELEQEFKEKDNFEIGITQAFQFPTYYYHQYKSLQLTREQQATVFQAARQKIIEETKINLHKLAFLEYQIKQQQTRLKKADQFQKFFNVLLEEGEISQLTLNQAKIHKIEYQNLLTDLLNRKTTIKKSLQILNGGKSLKTGEINFSEPVKLISTNNLKDDYLRHNPELQLKKINHQIAESDTKIAKYNWLPNFRIGVHQEKEAGPFLHYGISIPLWKNKNKVARAKASQNYSQATRHQSEISVEAEIDQLLAQYEATEKKYQSNLHLQKNLNSEQLLEKSLRAGEISAIEYFTELEKLYRFEDQLQQTKLDLKLLIVRLISFRI